MSQIFLLGSLQDVITRTFYTLAQKAGHGVRIYEDIGDLDSLPETPLPEEEQPDYVIVCHHGWMDYHNLREFLEALFPIDDDHPVLAKTTLLISCTSTPGYATAYDTPYLDPLMLKRLVVYSPLAFYQQRHVVEFAPTLATTAHTIEQTSVLFESMGIRAYQVSDTPGLVLPRILAMLVNEAASAVMEGVATAKDVDTAMKLGANYPEGPLAWADQIGIDVICQILDTMANEYFDDRYRPILLLKQMAGSGKLGTKTGEGFYVYADRGESRNT